MKNILAVIPAATQADYDMMISAAGNNKIIFKSVQEVCAEDVDNADIIIGNVPPKFYHEQNLEFVQLTSAGADAYVKEGLLSRNTVLSCCSGAYSQTVAEHALAVTLMLLKKLHLYRDDQNSSVWADEGTTGTIDGARVLIIGLGDIGCYYAKMAKALGAYIIGIKKRVSEKPDFVDEMYTTESFDSIVGNADIVVSFLPGTPETEHFFTPERFGLMKPEAVFINCGRGNVVALDVLYEVLSKNIISCAGIDVFETEPLPESSPLWGLRNIMITPHASGFFHLPVTKTRVMDICSGNLKAWLNGENVKNIVDYNLGYRK